MKTGQPERHLFNKQTVKLPLLLFGLLALMAGVFSPAESWAVTDSLCARVKIEIEQELTLERQAFDAHMRINNGLSHITLENVKVTVNFADEDGNTVLATSDPNNTSALFFIRVDSMENIGDVDGNGSVAPSTSADIHWLIIPALGASDGQPQGTMYYVGATLTYTMGGEENVTEVNPDYIFVKPMPELSLDYFLAKDVYGDDAFTPEIEPEIPFTLGVRVYNSGFGVAKKLKIESAQPKIVENELGLLINFQIIGSEVNGEPATESLLIDFGDIDPSTSGIGRWIMVCSLSGRFVEFSAEYTHADELGGELTSLLKEVNTHFLVHDVLVDLPGRDDIKDFLAVDEGTYTVYESETIDTEVNDQSSTASMALSGQSGTEVSHFLTVEPVPLGFLYIKLSDPYSGDKELKEVRRSDGKQIKAENSWLSKSRNKDTKEWEYYFNLFDANTTNSYTVVFGDKTQKPEPPVLQYIGPKPGAEGEKLSFLVEASDPNGTIPFLSAVPLPPLAKLTDQGNGMAIFEWTPAPGQSGRYEVTFSASDGALKDTELVVLTICSAADTDCDGMADSCETTYFGNLDRNGDGDFDGDGVSDRDECLNGTDPTYKETALEFNRGLNLFGYPVQVPAGYTSYNLLQALGDDTEVDKIQRYNRATQSMDTTLYTAGAPSGDEFPISDGEGYYVYMKVKKSVNFAGQVVCQVLNLGSGLNVVTFPCVAAGFDSEDLLERIGADYEISSIQRFNRVTGRFETTLYYDGSPSGARFAVVGGEAYLIQMKRAKTVVTPLE